jgi:CheY-like chemotaxis protein
MQDARDMYALYLTTHGLRVATAVNGEEAVRLTHDQRPALVLMDLGLPVMDGCEAIRRIKADPRGAKYPHAGDLRARFPRLRASGQKRGGQ